MVMAIILALLAIAALETAQRLSIFIVHAIATGIAAWYCWRIADVSRALLGRSVASVQSDPATTWINGRAERRLMARHLRLSIAMTAHYSLFPHSSQRGRAIFEALAA